jgi:predicted Zn-dependent peptidase
VKIDKQVLDNGLEVVTVELPHLHSVSVVMYARVGSRYESARDNGLSHFLEHMLFRGTERLPSTFDFHRAIESVGGTLYAETGRDYSLYQIAVHPDSLEDGIALFGEIFRAPAFSDVEVERRIVIEEMLEDVDDRGRIVNIDDLARRAVWPDHALGYSIVGPLGNVRRFTRADVRRHFSRFYGARNMVLCISGSFERARAMRAVRRSMSGVRPGRAVAVEAPTDGQRKPRVLFADTDASQTSTQILFRGLAERDPDYPAMVMMARVIDDGMSARLHTRIIDELGLAYSIGASLDSFTDTGLFEIDGASRHASTPELIREALGICDRLRHELCSADELDKARRRWRWDLDRALDDADMMAAWWGGGSLFARPDTFAERIAKMNAVTPDRIREVARRVFRPETLTVACVGPRSSRRESQIRKSLATF